jgi:hypothetical protein
MTSISGWQYLFRYRLWTADWTVKRAETGMTRDAAHRRARIGIADGRVSSALVDGSRVSIVSADVLCGYIKTPRLSRGLALSYCY